MFLRVASSLNSGGRHRHPRSGSWASFLLFPLFLIPLACWLKTHSIGRSRHSAIQNFPNLTSQRVASERLGQEIATFSKHPVSPDGLPRITGHVNHNDMGGLSDDLLRKDSPAHAGHDHVCEEQVYGEFLLAADLKSGGSTAGLKYAISARFQYVYGKNK